MEWFRHFSIKQKLLLSYLSIVIIYAGIGYVLFNFSSKPLFSVCTISSSAFIIITIIFYISRAITLKISYLSGVLNKIISGDIDIESLPATNDEFTDLIKSFSEISHNILRYRQYLENILTPIIITNNESDIIYLNITGANILGKKKEEVIGHKYSEYFKFEDCQKVKPNVLNMTDFDNVNSEKKVTKFNEMTLPAIFTKSKLRDSGGQIIGSIELVTPVNENTELQDHLNNSTELLIKAMQKFSEGDLSVKIISENSNDNIGKLIQCFNLTVQNINIILLRVSKAIKSTVIDSNQIYSTCNNMSAGVKEQSMQISEIVGTMEGMTKTITETSRNAEIAAESSDVASSYAQRGTEKIEETKRGMEKIVSSTQKTGKIINSLTQMTDQIGEITHIIDDIASQTNLLALNAAIEAARAGEQGRGFAIVADEVRKLAERTTNATKEIAATISTIQNGTKEANQSMAEAGESVKEGMNLTEEVTGVLSEILAMNTALSDLIYLVSNASQEQSKNANFVTNNVASINDFIQQSASGNQNILKTTMDLNNILTDLNDLFMQFQLEDRCELISTKDNALVTCD